MKREKTKDAVEAKKGRRLAEEAKASKGKLKAQKS